MVKYTIFVMFVVFSSQLLAEETPKAEIVQIDVKPISREIHPQTGRPIYEATETIPTGIVAHIREKDGTFRGAGISAGVVRGTFFSSCSGGSCRPASAYKPAFVKLAK